MPNPAATSTSTRVLVLLLLVWSIASLFTGWKRRAAATREIKPPFWLRLAVGLGVMAGACLMAFLFARLLPEASLAAEVGTTVAIAAFVLTPYWRRYPRRSTPGMGSWWIKLDYLGALALLAMEMHWYVRTPRVVLPALGALSIWVWAIAGVLVLILLALAPGIIVAWALEKSTARADHEGAMRTLQRCKWFVIRPMYDDFQAMLLLHAGEAKQVEQTIRDRFDKSRVPALQDAIRDTLGQALLDQGRLEEAEEQFEKVIQKLPTRMSGYDGLGEIRILQGRPREALDSIEKAIECEAARSALVRKFEAYEQAHLLANRAWAEAALGWRAKAEEALELAVKAAGSNQVALAGVHYRAGMLWNVLGRASKAREHFQEALSLDPRGRYGKKSREAELAGV